MWSSPSEAVAHAGEPSHFQLGEAGDGLRPPERLLDALALAGGVGRMSCAGRWPSA